MSGDTYLDALIECRASTRSEEDTLQAMWREAEVRDLACRCRVSRALWYAFHLDLADTRA